MQFTLTIELGNEAMRRYSDLRWAAKELVKQLESEAGTPKDGDGRKLRDINGNTVGSWEVTETPAEQAAEDRETPEPEEQSTPSVEWRDNRPDGTVLGWCVVDGGLVYPFGVDAFGKEMAEREAWKWDAGRFGGQPDPKA